MIFQDNVIKEYLKNVYFITGTPCGGKTTVSRALGKKYGIQVYDIDEMFPSHQLLSNAEHQPAMNMTFTDADEFFGRSVEEYRNWLIANTREQLDFVVLDLIRLSKNAKVICDCHLTVEQADLLSIMKKSGLSDAIREESYLCVTRCRSRWKRPLNCWASSPFTKATRRML